MAFVVDPAVRDMFLESHEMSTRVVCLRGSQNLGEIPVSEVSVFATYGTRGGRDGTMTVDRLVIDRGLLDPMSDQFVVYTGIKGVVEVPIFTGRVDTQNEYESGAVLITPLSRGMELLRAQFEVPWPVTSPLLNTMEMARIIQDVDPTWAVDSSRASGSFIPENLLFEFDRGAALDQLAQGGNLIWQPDRTGGFTIYDNPYMFGPLLVDESVVTLRDGVGGILVDVFNAKSRDGIYNSITVVVERVNNTAPIRVTVRDNDPGSPTRWGGPFGKQNLVVKNQSPIGVTEAVALATRILRQSLALQRNFRISVPHMPLLDPGDVFTLNYQGEILPLVVESITYFGYATDMTTISARELRLQNVEVS